MNAAARPSSAVDIAVSHPRDGQMRLVSRYLFDDSAGPVCREFVRTIFEVAEVWAIEIRSSSRSAHVEYTNGVVPCRDVIDKIARRLRNGRRRRRASQADPLRALPLSVAGNAEGWWIERHGDVLSTWKIRHELPGRIRFGNRLIRGKTALCRAIDRALRGAPGVESSTTNPRTATTLILFDPTRVDRQRLLAILDQALIDGEPVNGFHPTSARETPPATSPPRSSSTAAQSYTGTERAWSAPLFVITGLGVGVAAVTSALSPPLGLLVVPPLLYLTRGMYVSAARSLASERRVSVDTLMAGINIASIIGGYYFLFALNAFAILCARNLVDKVKRDSRGDYTDIFRQQSRTVLLRVDGAQIETPLVAVKVGDLVIISAGQTIPVDGHVADGVGTIDQHLLTGEAAPADRGPGDAVFAMTVLLSGRITVRVERTGVATVAAQIARVLDNTVDFKTGRQLWSERIADRLVGPALLSGLVASPWLGLSAAGALVDAHPKYRATLASSLSLLNYFKLAAREGVLIKDGRTLELLNDVDTVVFDKTGTLTLAQPHVGRIYTCGPHSADDVLRLAAASEQHQSHPIAWAILHVAGARGLSVSPIAESEYRLGFGLSVRVEGSTISVGSMRFIEMQVSAIPPALVDVQARCHHEGHSLVVVAVDGEVVGAIELRPSLRPEAPAVVRGLKQRGIRSLYIISGDHEAPTRRLAGALGIEHYFAETLPDDKATLVEGLQRAGKVVCYVGDGINDSIAMKKAAVSVSLRGASTIATDTAEVVLLDGSLHRLAQVFDIARESHRNTKTTIAAVFVPGVLCVAGVLLYGFGFGHSRVINVLGLAAGVGSAMLPWLTHRPALADTGGADTNVSTDDAAIEECVIA